VYLLTIIAASYNLFYTWYGRQIFWIDIENIAVSTLFVIYKLVVIFEAEKAYIVKILHLETKNFKVMSAGVDDDIDKDNRNDTDPRYAL
jgi:hypothetical protein